MRKFTLILLLSMFVSLIYLVSASSQEDMRFVSSDDFDKAQRPPAVFNHDEHNDLAEIEECNECHHVYDEEGNRIEDESSEDQSCSECHEQEASGRIPGLMKAFHLNCKGCHKKQKKGPVMCGQCHVRRPVLAK